MFYIKFKSSLILNIYFMFHYYWPWTSVEKMLKFKIHVFIDSLEWKIILCKITERTQLLRKIMLFVHDTKPWEVVIDICWENRMFTQKLLLYLDYFFRSCLHQRTTCLGFHDPLAGWETYTHLSLMTMSYRNFHLRLVLVEIWRSYHYMPIS